MSKVVSFLVLAFLSISPGRAGVEAQAKGAQEGPPQSEIDRAVAHATSFVVEQVKAKDKVNALEDELILAALVYGGLPETNADIQHFLKRTIDKPPAGIYEAVLLAIALDKLDPEVYFWKLVEIAQHLIDSQCANGCWTYAHATPPAEETKKVIEELKEAGKKAKANRKKDAVPMRPRTRVPLKGKPSRSTSGDNSNAQFAAFGIWVCAQAGIDFPPETLKLGADYWVKQQEKDGGWMYYDKDGMIGQSKDETVTMTAGGVSSLLVLQGLLEGTTPKAKPLRDGPAKKAVEQGVKWLDAHWTFNPKGTLFMSAPYSHYSIERVGIIGYLQKIGSHAWYAEGAADLLKTQEKDGAWRLTKNGPKGGKEPQLDWAVIDTCLAILFFKRSVTPVIPTER